MKTTKSIQMWKSIKTKKRSIHLLKLTRKKKKHNNAQRPSAQMIQNAQRNILQYPVTLIQIIMVIITIKVTGTVYHILRVNQAIIYFSIHGMESQNGILMIEIKLGKMLDKWIITTAVGFNHSQYNTAQMNGCGISTLMRNFSSKVNLIKPL